MFNANTLVEGKGKMEGKVKSEKKIAPWSRTDQNDAPGQNQISGDSVTAVCNKHTPAVKKFNLPCTAVRSYALTCSSSRASTPALTVSYDVYSIAGYPNCGPG
jgi:hypothetical protein